jgi:hypothetical protein
MLNGSRISIDGTETLAKGGASGCFVGRWTNGLWDIDADEVI